MDPFLGSVILGAIGAGGQIFANRANTGSAREQMRFQERMASTQAQRAVADYKAAGLNPALAYDRPAAAPAGASTRHENVGEKGVSSALAGRRLMSELKLLEEQTEKTRNERRSAEVAARVASNTEEAETLARLAEARARLLSAPYDPRLKELELTMGQYSMPGMIRTLRSQVVPPLVSGAKSAAKLWEEYIKRGMLVAPPIPKPRFR